MATADGYPRTVQQYLNRVALAVRKEDGAALAPLLRVVPPPRERAEWLSRLRSADLEDAISGKLEPPFDELVYAHLQAAQMLNGKHLDDAHSVQCTYCNMILANIGEWDRWCIPLVYMAAYDLRMLAVMADAPEQGSERLAEAARIILRLFNACATDRAALGQSKKWGALHIANQAFRLYFRLRQPRLVSHIFRVLGLPGFPPLERFPKAQVVTLRFYQGLAAFYEEQYDRAHEEFMYAFQHCPRGSRQKRTVLLYLVPTRLIVGRGAPMALVRKYRLSLYYDILDAVRHGHLARLASAIDAHMATASSLRLCLALERLHLNCFRALFRKTHAVLGRTSRVTIASLHAAVRFAGEPDMEADSVEAIVLRLIDMGWVRGYVSQEKRVVVLSQANPFPSGVAPTL